MENSHSPNPVSEDIEKTGHPLPLTDPPIANTAEELAVPALHAPPSTPPAAVDPDTAQNAPPDGTSDPDYQEDSPPEGHAPTEREGHSTPGETEPADSSAATPEPGSLEDYAQRAKKGRLKAEEEAEAARLFQACLEGGRAEVGRTVAVAPLMPWVVVVQATTAAWPEMKPTFRSQFLAGLARTPGESAARMRLSLARGMFKVDAAASLKLILLTLKVLRDKQTGLLEGRGASLFSSVLIGRGKAWVLQVPLADLKPVEADLLVFAALHAAFHQPQAPITQLGILKWAANSGRLGKLPETLEQLVFKNIHRWSSKWQSTLRREVPALPDSWLAQLKHVDPAVNRRGEEAPSADPDSVENNTSPEDAPRGSRGRNLIEAPGEAGDGSDAPEPDDTEDEKDAEEDAQHPVEQEEEGERGEREPKPRRERPEYISKTIPQGHGHGPSAPAHGKRGAPGAFNLQDTLRQVEQYVNGLRNELQFTQKQLRLKDDDLRRSKRPERVSAPVNPGEFSLEELLRLNNQLELRNAELKSRIDELTGDSEARAVSSGLMGDFPTPSADEQLRTLLGLKLKDDHEDFLALEQEARDIVVQQHYRTLLRHVFDVLKTEGIRFPEGGV